MQWTAPIVGDDHDGIADDEMWDDVGQPDELEFGSVPPWQTVAAASPLFLPWKPSFRSAAAKPDRPPTSIAATGPFANLRSRLPPFLRNETRFSRMTNYVVKVFFSHQIYRSWIALYVPYAEYLPGRLPAVKIRLTNSFSNTTCLIFHSGFMILTGARTFYTAYRDAVLYRMLFQDLPQPALVHQKGKLPPPVSEVAPVGMLAVNEVGPALINDPSVRLTAQPLGPHFQICCATIVNTVSTGVLCAHSLALDKIQRRYPESASYNPHTFAGLYFWVNSEDCPELEYLVPPEDAEIMFGDRFVGEQQPGTIHKPHSRRASVFDSGSCSIIGKSPREGNYAIYRHLARLFESFDDPTRPRLRDQIHAYRLDRYLNQRNHEDDAAGAAGAGDGAAGGGAPAGGLHTAATAAATTPAMAAMAATGSLPLFSDEERALEDEEEEESVGMDVDEDMDDMLINDFLGLTGLQ